ncbi:bromodomain-containing protein 8 [Nilaparvata lugens]|uniref:bromodomain-containing protein 8 n=1 Tax=Nilaparvata lugens TaxID=108931 RepID=UPI00193C96F0|nr:bromodomain-containing protein 8 [Nilaparvata lugens]
MLVYNRLATHKYASLFLKPITNEQALGYHSVIHRPMDLSTIKKNIELGNLRTTVEFQRDMMLMFQNAIMYNNKKTLVYEMATEMQAECIQHIQLMVEAMGEGVPLRSEADESDTLKLTRGSGRVGKSVEPWSQQTAAESSRKRKRSSLPPDTAPSAGSKKKKMQADDEGKKN